MRSDNSALSTVQDALGLGASKVDTAYTGMNNVLTTIGQIKTKLLSTIGQTDAAKAKTQTEITALQAQMKSFADAATFSGSNFLAVTSKQVAAANDGVQPDSQIVSSFNRSSSGAISIGTINIDVEGTKLFDYGLATDVKNYGTLDRQTSIYATGAAQTLYDTAYAATLATGGETRSVTVTPEPVWFAHFKYHAGFRRKVHTEVARRQHFNGAEEYTNCGTTVAHVRASAHSNNANTDPV
jgi:flagellin